jgi:hypothetical protein
MLLIVFSLGILNFFWGEKVPAGGGLGWDGVTYANMVKNLDQMLLNDSLSGYYIQRVFPSAVVRGLLLLFDAQMIDINIIHAFELYNLSLLLLACFLWKQLADHFSLSILSRWIGFGGLFINFQCSKQAFYYPVLTDVTALLVGLLLLLFYLKRKHYSLFFTTILGSFCWPAVGISGAFLLLFLNIEPSRNFTKNTTQNIDGKSTGFFSYITIGLPLILILSIISYIAVIQIQPVNEQDCKTFNEQVKPLIVTLRPDSFVKFDEFIHRNGPCAIESRLFDELGSFISAIPSIYVIAIAFGMLIGSRSYFTELVRQNRKIDPLLVIMAGLSIILPTFLSRHFSDPNIINVNTYSAMIHGILFTPSGEFFLPFVSIAVFWGPLTLLLFLNWESFCNQARNLGPGFMAVVAISLPLAMPCEPRFITISWPFLVLGVVLVTDKLEKKPSFNFVLMALTLLWAQFWFKLNWAHWEGGQFDGLKDFPKQMYFMHYGGLMSWWAYLIQFLMLIVSAILIFKTMKKD